MLVALCDDENAQLDHIEKFLQKYRESRELKVSRFDNGEKLLEEYRHGTRYDIIFLDIIMGQLNGIDIAKRLRETDNKAIIIFLTNLMDYALEGYEVDAFRYLIKPLDQEKFDTVFTLAMNEAILHKERYYAINTSENEKIKLDMDNIIFLESFGRRMSVHLNGSSVEYLANISAVEEKLASFGFIRIHKSYIVNFKFIIQISRSVVTLKDGINLPLSRQRQKAVFNAFTQYLVNNAM